MLDDVDKRILRTLQEDLPIVSRPFAEVADKIGITEEEFFLRVKKLIDSGIIRKFGLRIDSAKVGFASTLIGLKVPEDKLEEIAKKLNKYNCVTHNYSREHEYNLWITVIEQNQEKLNEFVKKIVKEDYVQDMVNLPTKTRFKINVKFDLE